MSAMPAVPIASAVPTAGTACALIRRHSDLQAVSLRVLTRLAFFYMTFRTTACNVSMLCTNRTMLPTGGLVSGGRPDRPLAILFFSTKAVASAALLNASTSSIGTLTVL
eukprot:SAG22_NODE_7254_length_757_cov_1.635258_1_plen_109_part_00